MKRTAPAPEPLFGPTPLKRPRMLAPPVQANGSHPPRAPAPQQIPTLQSQPRCVVLTLYDLDINSYCLQVFT